MVFLQHFCKFAGLASCMLDHQGPELVLNSISDSTTKALSMQQKNGGTLFRNFKCEENCGSRKAC